MVAAAWGTLCPALAWKPQPKAVWAGAGGSRNDRWSVGPPSALAGPPHPMLPSLVRTGEGRVESGVCVCVCVQSVSCVWLFVAPWIIAYQAKHLRVELLNHMANIMFNFLRNCQTIFHSNCIILCSYQQWTQISISLHSHQHLLFSSF